MAGKQGATWERPMSREQRDNLALTNIEMLLDKQIAGKKKVSPARLMAARIRYDKLRPALSAIDQTVHNADDVLTEEQILLKFQNLIALYPDLLPRLNAIQGQLASPPQLSTDTDPTTA